MGFIKPLVTVVILYKTKYFNGENIHKVMSARIVIINSNRDYFIDLIALMKLSHTHTRTIGRL